MDIYLVIMLLIRYFVLSFSDYDLNKVIRRQKPFTEKHIRLIIYSILRGLKVQFCIFSSLCSSAENLFNLGCSLVHAFSWYYASCK